MTGPVSATRPTLNRSDRPGAPTPRIYPLGSTFLDGQMNFSHAELVRLWHDSNKLECYAVCQTRSYQTCDIRFMVSTGKLSH